MRTSLPLSLLAALAACTQPPARPARGQLVVQPASLDFGPLTPGASLDLSVRLSNPGAGPTTVTTVHLTGEAPAAFSMLDLPEPDFALASSEERQFRLRFAPPAAGLFSARLVVESDAANTELLELGLLGRGQEPDRCGAITCDRPPGPCFAVAGTCDGGTCGYAPSPAGTGCDDADDCTDLDVCDGTGRCLGTPRRCEQGAGCVASQGSCHRGRCEYPPRPLGEPCDDGEACTSADACDGAGRCAGSPLSCPPPAPWCLSPTTQRTPSEGTCNPNSVSCTFVTRDIPCALGCDDVTGLCATSCPAGTHECNGSCVPQSPTACGPSCMVCPAGPAGGVPVCDAGTCDFGCALGTLRVAGACVPCDVVVPTQAPTIAAAVLAAPTPGTVCVEAGTWTGDVLLRPHVNLRGVGPNTVVVGALSASALGDVDPTPTRISDLTLRAAHAGITMCPLNDLHCVQSQSLEGRTVAVEVARVHFVAVPPNTVYLGKFDYGMADAGLSLTVRDSVLEGGAGFRVASSHWALPGITTVFAERNRIIPGPGSTTSGEAFAMLQQCYAATGGSAAQCPVGTRFDGTYRNNEVVDAWYEPFYFGRSSALSATDRAASGMRFVNNTIICANSATYAFWNNGSSSDPQVTVANTLSYGCAGLMRGRQPTFTAANLQPTSSPFMGLDAGDLRLAPGAPAVDTGSTTWAPSDDLLALPRPVDGDGNGTVLPDVGARERRP